MTCYHDPCHFRTGANKCSICGDEKPMTTTTAAQPLDLDRLKVIAELLRKRGSFAISGELDEMIAQARAARLDTTASVSERAAFEVWATITGPWAECFLTLMWDAWQARATLAPVAAQQDIGEIWSEAVADPEFVREIDADRAMVAAQQAAAKVGRDWIEDAAHENGNYECLCSTCGNKFFGHKRRVTCKDCAAKAPAAQAVTASKSKPAFIIRDFDAPVGLVTTVASLDATSPASTPESSQQTAAVAAPSDKKKLEDAEKALATVNEVLSTALGFGPDNTLRELLWAVEGSLKQATAPTAGAATTSEDARDAARYRWLRDHPWSFELPSLAQIIQLQQNSLWDEQIDSAMRATQQEGE